MHATVVAQGVLQQHGDTALQQSIWSSFLVLASGIPEWRTLCCRADSLAGGSLLEDNQKHNHCRGDMNTLSSNYLKSDLKEPPYCFAEFKEGMLIAYQDTSAEEGLLFGLIGWMADIGIKSMLRQVELEQRANECVFTVSVVRTT